MRRREFNNRVYGAAPRTNRYRKTPEEEIYEDFTREFYGTDSGEEKEDNERLEMICIDSGTETDEKNDSWFMSHNTFLPPTTRPIEIDVDEEWIEEVEEEIDDDEADDD